MLDPYVYEGTEVLKNKFGIKDKSKLKEAEADVTFAKLLTVDRDVDSSKFDSNYIKNIHKYIFGDVFDWAGEYRKVLTVKPERLLTGLSVDYSKPQNIENDLKENLKKLNSTDWKDKDIDEKSLEFAKKLAAIWQVHPFREGNTRTILTFAFRFADEHGFPLNKDHVLAGLATGEEDNFVRSCFVMASIGEYSDYSHLKKLLKDSMIIEEEKRKSVQKESNTKKIEQEEER